MKKHFSLLLLTLISFLSFAQKEENIEIKPHKSGTEEIYDFAEVNPKFPGGNDSLVQWLAANLRYPPEAKKSGIQGKVYVRFEVSKNGKVLNPQIVRGINEQFNKEAIRLVESMPTWTPGSIKGKIVIVRMVLTIEFKLDN